MKRIAILAAAAALALSAGTAMAQDYYHDESTSQHIGRVTTPAMGARASEPVQLHLHDENTTQHVGRTTTPAMGSRPDAVITFDYHDENSLSHVRSK